jgi:hypothetical protein
MLISSSFLFLLLNIKVHPAYAETSSIPKVRGAVLIGRGIVLVKDFRALEKGYGWIFSSKSGKDII